MHQIKKQITLNPKSRKGTNKMKFFQVMTTNKFQSTLDRQYVNVYNFASLAEALKTLRLYEDKDAVDGYTYTDSFGRKVVQHHLNYEENGGAVIELRHEYFGFPEGCSVEQVVNQEAVYVKEINL